MKETDREALKKLLEESFSNEPKLITEKEFMSKTAKLMSMVREEAMIAFANKIKDKDKLTSKELNSWLFTTMMTFAIFLRKELFDEEDVSGED